MKILWLSRHSLSEEQLAGLRNLYGEDLQIKHVDRTVTHYREVLEYGADCDVLAVVLPTHILSLLTDPTINNKPIIQSVSSRMPTEFKNWNRDSQKLESVYAFHHEYWLQVLQVQVQRLT